MRQFFVTKPPRRQKGYILALNIAVLALMLVGAAYMENRISLARDLARAEKQRIDGEFAVASAKARVLYLLSAAPRSRFGLGMLPNASIALDGTPYRIGREVIVNLQDIKGLFSLNTRALEGNGRTLLERLLATYDLDGETVGRLADTLLDYRDGDDLRHINGAEKEDYAHAGKAGDIRNADFLSPTEISRVLGFSEIFQRWPETGSLVDHLHVSRVLLFNPNTADWRILVAMTGIPAELAQSLEASRRRGETPDISQLLLSGTSSNPFSSTIMTTLFPSETIIVTLRYVGSPSGVRMAVKHTPTFAHSPWIVQYTYRVPLPALTQEEIDALPELPPLSSVRDLNAPYQVQLPF